MSCNLLRVVYVMQYFARVSRSGVSLLLPVRQGGDLCVRQDITPSIKVAKMCRLGARQRRGFSPDDARAPFAHLRVHTDLHFLLFVCPSLFLSHLVGAH